MLVFVVFGVSVIGDPWFWFQCQKGTGPRLFCSKYFQQSVNSYFHTSPHTRSQPPLCLRIAVCRRNQAARGSGTISRPSPAAEGAQNDWNRRERLPNPLSPRAPTSGKIAEGNAALQRGAPARAVCVIHAAFPSLSPNNNPPPHHVRARLNFALEAILHAFSPSPCSMFDALQHPFLKEPQHTPPLVSNEQVPQTKAVFSIKSTAVPASFACSSRHHLVPLTASHQAHARLHLDLHPHISVHFHNRCSKRRTRWERCGWTAGLSR